MTDDHSLQLNTIQSNKEMMETIATNQQSLDDIKLLTSSKVTDQLKVFLIAQARNELMRVIKLTEFLDRLEDSFMHKVDDAIINDELTLKQFGEVIGTITSLLGRSNEIISKVLKDDSLTTILNTTIYSNDNTSTQTTVISQLQNPQSRERVRAVIQTIINKANEQIIESGDNNVGV